MPTIALMADVLSATLPAGCVFVQYINLNRRGSNFGNSFESFIYF